MTATAFIGLGANLGDRVQTLQAALQRLSQDPDIDMLCSSGPWQSAPVGGPNGQQDFINGAASLRTSLGPRALLDRMLEVEALFGRVRRVRWGPRTLDLDLLLYGDVVVDEPGLTVPHPLLEQRTFVLRPLLEVAPDLTHPVLGRRLAEFLTSLRVDESSIQRMDGPPLFSAAASAF